MDGSSVSLSHLIMFRCLVLYQTTVETDAKRTVFHIDLFNDADVTVEYILIIIVTDLHHPVAQLVVDSTPADPQRRSVESLLEEHVQIPRPHDTP